MTLQFFGDLECNTTRWWVERRLPAIIREFVRPGVVKIEYRSFKTDTHNPSRFVNQQTAAVAAGAQSKLWPFIETFYHEQGIEYTPYVTERFLDGIARQVLGLNLARWHRDRLGGGRSVQVARDDEAGRVAGLHDTPGFLIGRTNGKLEVFFGRTITRYYRGASAGEHPEAVAVGKNGSVPLVLEANPVSLIDARDLKSAVSQLMKTGSLKVAQAGGRS